MRGITTADDLYYSPDTRTGFHPARFSGSYAIRTPHVLLGFILHVVQLHSDRNN
jgi:hypothetical protein